MNHHHRRRRCHHHHYRRCHQHHYYLQWQQQHDHHQWQQLGIRVLPPEEKHWWCCPCWSWCWFLRWFQRDNWFASINSNILLAIPPSILLAFAASPLPLFSTLPSFYHFHRFDHLHQGDDDDMWGRLLITGQSAVKRRNWLHSAPILSNILLLFPLFFLHHHHHHDRHHRHHHHHHHHHHHLVCYSVPFRGTPRPPGVHRRTEATAGEWGPVERRPFGNMGTSWTKTSWKQAQGGIRNISSLIR